MGDGGRQISVGGDGGFCHISVGEGVGGGDHCRSGWWIVAVPPTHLQVVVKIQHGDGLITVA